MCILYPDKNWKVQFRVPSNLLHRYLVVLGSGISNRETREGWPLLTVGTEVNGDLKSTNERDPSLVGSLGLPYRYKIFLFCLGCSVFGSPSPSKLGRQPCWVV